MTAVLRDDFPAELNPELQAKLRVLDNVDPELPPTFDAESFAAELDAIRQEVLDSLGQDDADYIHNLVRLQQRLDLAGRLSLMAGIFPPAWLAGTAMLGVSKILENMELGHNVMHGQWDWTQDPELQSATYEWDNACLSEQWQHTHNYMHHQWTNVIGRDRDIGYGILRVDPHQKWKPVHLTQPLIFAALALAFEYGVSFHDSSSYGSGGWKDRLTKVGGAGRKIVRQIRKDYLAWPLLSLPFGPVAAASSITGAIGANVIRNVWAFSVIFCGHFPDGVNFFTQEEADAETRGDWYRRQVMGSVNFTGGPLMDVMSGNLDHQIEHHLFPDLPANRYAEIAPRVQDLCERHGLSYNTESFATQFSSVIRKILRLSLP
jgi:linoleoyl-CoA desaturase